LLHESVEAKVLTPVSFNSKTSAAKTPSKSIKHSKNHAKEQKQEEMLVQVSEVLEEVANYIGMVNVKAPTNDMQNYGHEPNPNIAHCNTPARYMTKQKPPTVSANLTKQVANTKSKHRNAPVELCFPPSHIVPVNYLDSQPGGYSRQERRNRSYHEACQRVRDKAKPNSPNINPFDWAAVPVDHLRYDLSYHNSQKIQYKDKHKLDNFVSHAKAKNHHILQGLQSVDKIQHELYHHSFNKPCKPTLTKEQLDDRIVNTIYWDTFRQIQRQSKLFPNIFKLGFQEGGKMCTPCIIQKILNHHKQCCCQFKK
jgi:hypothetical protein